MKILIVLLFIIYGKVYAQTQIKVVPLTSHDPKIEDSDLCKIDSIFVGVKVVGIGECTHGTSEFTPMRHRIFKYLVEHHGFNTVFIEADYSACLRLNRYINGESDDADKVLSDLMYFAWTTEEMKEFAEWMRNHNLNSPDKIQIIGCDMQSLADDKKEIERTMQTLSIPNFLNTLKPPYKDTMEVRKALIEWTAFYNNSLVNQTASGKAKLVDASIKQFLVHKFYTTSPYNYRDSCMAVNMLTYLHLNPNSKGIWMAHNNHVSKTKYDYESSYSYKTAGQFLGEHLNRNYISIAQTTNSGYFNAWTYIKNKAVFSVCELKKAERNSLEKKISELDQNILMCAYSSIPDVHKLNYTEIGHTYGKTNMKHKIKRYKKLTKEKYDYVIYFESTKESTILKNK